MKQTIGLMATGFVQVFFVSVNTYMVARGLYVGVYAASFVISLVWSLNVRRVAFGDWWDRIAYATGAALGAVSGLASSKFIVTMLNLLTS